MSHIRSSARCRRSSPSWRPRLVVGTAGLTISALTYVARQRFVGCTDGTVNFWKRSIAQVAITFAATTTGRRRRAGRSHPDPAEGGLTATRATPRWAVQQSVQVIATLCADLFQHRGGSVDEPVAFRPDCHPLYLIAGVGTGHRRRIPVRAHAAALAGDGTAPEDRGGTSELIELVREPKTIGTDRARLLRNDPRCRAGAWASVAAFGGGATF